MIFFSFFNSLFTSVAKPGYLGEFISGDVGFGNGFVCNSDPNISKPSHWILQASRVEFSVSGRGFMIFRGSFQNHWEVMTSTKITTGLPIKLKCTGRIRSRRTKCSDLKDLHLAMRRDKNHKQSNFSCLTL